MADHGVADWTALPNDLIKKIGDIFLSTDDLDYYVVLRAVYGSWRRATPEHFMPSKWIILKHSMSPDYLVDEVAVTLLNVSNGRCLEKKIPRVIHRYFFIATAGGLVVLGQRVRRNKTRLFNPLTGAIKHLRAQIPAEELSAIVVTMSLSLMVFASDLQNHTLWWADESIEEGSTATGFGEGYYSAPYVFGFLRSMTQYNGDVFDTDKYGSIISTMTSAAEEERSVRTLQMNTTIAGPIPGAQFRHNLFYLVESEGKLLFVVSGRVLGKPVVYRVDTKNRVLETVRSIGSHTLFVGKNQFISVDSRKVHIVEADIIYYMDLYEIRPYDYERLTREEMPKHAGSCAVGGLWHNERPFTLDELLAEYCKTIKESELQKTPYDEDGYYEYYDGSASE